MITINEMSIVSNDLLYYIPLRVTKRTASGNNKSFPGKTVSAPADCFKPPPGGRGSEHTDYNNI